MPKVVCAACVCLIVKGASVALQSFSNGLLWCMWVSYLVHDFVFGCICIKLAMRFVSCRKVEVVIVVGVVVVTDILLRNSLHLCRVD